MIRTSANTFFKQFFLQYPYIPFEDLIDYYSFFAGIDSINLDLYEPLDKIITDIALSSKIKEEFPFFLFDAPFRKFLMALAKSDGKMFSLFNKVKLSESVGMEIVEELISSGIIKKLESREAPLRIYPKQLLKKEFRYYKIEPKLYFEKPFYRFYFAFIEPFLSQKGDIETKALLENFYRYSYRLSSLVFEELSIELLKVRFQEHDNIIEYGSLWNYQSEFDIYCKTESGKRVIGECKYKNRPISKSELIKLKNKVVYSAIDVDYYTLFSKSGFSKELEKEANLKLLLFSLEDFKSLL